MYTTSPPLLLLPLTFSTVFVVWPKNFVLVGIIDCCFLHISWLFLFVVLVLVLLVAALVLVLAVVVLVGVLVGELLLVEFVFCLLQAHQVWRF